MTNKTPRQPRVIYLNEYGGELQRLWFESEEEANHGLASTHNTKRTVRKFIEVIDD